MSAVDAAIAAYQKLSGAERIDFLRALYARVGDSVTERIVGSLWSDVAYRFSRKVTQVKRDDRPEVIKGILHAHNTRFSRAYRELDINTKLSFWHRLMREQERSSGVQSAAVESLVRQTESLSAEQQFELVSQIV